MGEKTMITISEESLTKEDFIRDFLIPNQPLCISSSSCLRTWSAWKDWRTSDDELNLNFIAQLLGSAADSLPIPVSYFDTPYFNSHKSGSLTFNEFVSKMKNESVYLKDWHFTKDVPNYKAYTVPDIFTPDWLNEYWDKTSSKTDYRFVYIGPKGSWTPFHSDVFGSYSWSANIVGLKEWIFIRPGKEIHFKKYGAQSLLEDMCDSNFIDHGFKMIQKSGEIVFVPSGWHHQVKNLKDTISINHNWFNAYNIECIYNHLHLESQNVEKELRDIKGDENVKFDLTQNLLRSHHGMNYEDFLSYLSSVVENKKNTLGAFDVFQINKVLSSLVSEETHTERLRASASRLLGRISNLQIQSP